MKKTFSTFLLLLLFLLTDICLAQGGPPLFTDDPDPPGNNNWEINIFFSCEMDSSGSSSYEVPHIDLNYGLGDRIQLKWESGIGALSQDGAATRFGWEDSLFGVKWRIINGGETGISVGTYPQVGVRVLSSSDSEIAGPSTYAILPIEIKKGWGDIALDGEVGMLFVDNKNRGWSYGLCAGYNATKLIELTGELHESTGDSDLFPSGLVAQVGTRAGLNETVAIIAAIGTTVIVPAGSNSNFLLLGGIRLNL